MKRGVYMTDMQYTIVTFGLIFISFHVGYIIGKRTGLLEGFAEGAAQSVGSMLEALTAQFGLTLNADIVCKEVEEDEEIS